MNLFDWSLNYFKGILLGYIWREERHSLIKAQNWEIWFIICSVLAFLHDLEQGAWNIILFWIILIFKTSTLFREMKVFGYSKCYELTLRLYTQKNPPNQNPASPFPNCKRSNHCFFSDYFSLPWRTIFQEKKLVLCLVHQVNENHRAPLPSGTHPAESPKAITLFFQLSVHRKLLPLLPVYFYLLLSGL